MPLSVRREVPSVHKLELHYYPDRPEFKSPGSNDMDVWLSETRSDFPKIRITLKVSEDECYINEVPHNLRVFFSISKHTDGSTDTSIHGCSH